MEYARQHKWNTRGGHLELLLGLQQPLVQLRTLGHRLGLAGQEGSVLGKKG